MLANLAVLVLLIGVNAFFAAAEIAFLSINPNKVRQRADDGDKKAVFLRKTLDDPSRFLASIQIGVSLSGLMSGAFTARAFSDYATDFILRFNPPIGRDTLLGVVTLLLTVALSYFMLVFGELAPKRLAMKSTYNVSLFFARAVSVIGAALRPFVWFLSVSTNAVLRLSGVNPDEKSESVTEEEIRMMVDVGGTAGTIDENEKAMINNVFDFGNKTAEDVATHRKDLVALPIDATREEILEAAGEGYSRILVYEENIDDIIGVLYVKDLLARVVSGGGGIDLGAIIRKPRYVPVSKKADDLFEFMRKNKLHIVVVVDEYGGTAGIVTMEDLIEEVMGSILDEYDEEETPEIQRLPDNCYAVLGTADLESVAEELDAELPVDDYDTVSGFIVGQLGRIPQPDEKPEFEYGGLMIRVESVEGKRVGKAIICRV
ncbi:MAG: hemolysin family protein [Clostridiales bacterium]|nr:hemolysin family protein [Clostridiales bacterium]